MKEVWKKYCYDVKPVKKKVKESDFYHELNAQIRCDLEQLRKGENFEIEPQSVPQRKKQENKKLEKINQLWEHM